PLTKRFPLLGSPVAAIWYSGQMGDDSIPGPTTYWIDAVVTLTPGAAAEIEAGYDLHITTDVPDVVEALRADVPGDLWTSDSLAAALLKDGDAQSWTVKAYFSPTAGQIVLSARGQ
ncbi:MAG: hypothetical protein FWF36_08420, partial [Propionibacteriaceae bacterium]|nr:hypothetical protein [Propionibacteriaceae bacterium]